MLGRAFSTLIIRGFELRSALPASKSRRRPSVSGVSAGLRRVGGTLETSPMTLVISAAHALPLPLLAPPLPPGGCLRRLGSATGPVCRTLR